MRLAGLAFIVAALVSFGAFSSDPGVASHPYPDPNGYFSLYGLFKGNPEGSRSNAGDYTLCHGNWDWNAGWHWNDTVAATEQWGNFLDPDVSFHWDGSPMIDCSDWGQRGTRNIALYSLSNLTSPCGQNSTGCFRRMTSYLDVCDANYHTESGLPVRCQRAWGDIYYNYTKLRNLSNSRKENVATHEMGHVLSLDDDVTCSPPTVMENQFNCLYTAPQWNDMFTIKIYYHLLHLP